MFTLTTFSSLPILPTGMVAVPAGSAPTMDMTIQLPGGRVFDASEGKGPPDLPYDLVLQGQLLDTAGSYTFTEKHELLNRLRGWRSQLVRLWDDEVQTEYCYARLMKVEAPHKPKHIAFQDVTLTFRVDTRWYGTLHDDTITLVDPATVLYLVNNGTAYYTTEITLTLTAAATPITGFKVEGGFNGASAFEWTGSLPGGDVLTFDCGAPSVKLTDWPADPADAYNGFALLAGHGQEDWLRLAPGGGTITFTKTGGSAGDTLRVQWRELNE